MRSLRFKENKNEIQDFRNSQIHRGLGFLFGCPMFLRLFRAPRLAIFTKVSFTHAAAAEAASPQLEAASHRENKNDGLLQLLFALSTTKRN